MFIHLFDFLKTLEPPMIYFIIWLVHLEHLSFGRYRIRLTDVPFFSSTLLFVCRSNEQMKKCKSVNLLFFHVNKFSLSSLIHMNQSNSEVGNLTSKSDVVYNTLLVFLPLIDGKSVAHMSKTIIRLSLRNYFNNHTVPASVILSITCQDCSSLQS